LVIRDYIHLNFIMQALLHLYACCTSGSMGERLPVGRQGRSPIQLTFVAKQDLVCILRPGMNCDVLIHW